MTQQRLITYVAVPWSGTPWLIVPILLIAGGLRLFFSSSLSGNDDLSIANCALGLIDGRSPVGAGHYCARLGLTVPLAGIFSIAGTGTAQISLLPALGSAAAILLSWRLGTTLFGPASGAAAAAALALFPMDVEYAGLAFPDALQGSLLAGAVLCALLTVGTIPARHGPTLLAIIAGVLWAWAYYVKLDAFMLAPVLLAATLMKLVRWRHLIIIGFVALLLVGVELVVYAVLTGDPLYHLHVDSAASNEMLAAGMDYRNLFTFPRAMFVVPYEAGIYYYIWVIAGVIALVTRSRAALFLVTWCLIWQLWLTFGADPLSGFRLKPQLARYLLSWQVPMAVLAGWAWLWIWQRLRPLGLALAVATVGLVAVLGPFNQLSFKAALATRLSVAAALEQHWFPLYPDVQSLSIVHFLLRGRPEDADVHVVQRHDFLRGVTTFEAISVAPAYLLVNESYARQLEARNLVRPIDPTSFGRTATEVFEVDQPMSALSYASLRLLAGAAGLLLHGALGIHIQQTVAEVLRPGDARIWRLDR